MGDELTVRAQQVWSLGHYDRIAPRLEPAADALCEAAEVRPGVRVLDVAAGTGNVTLAALARGAEVVASDVSPHLIAQGRARTGDRVAWHEADARELPFGDAAFDVVLSAFGAIFAPDPERVAAELLRVTAPGGVVGLTAWTPDGVQGAAFEVLMRHLPPPPPGTAQPDAWGDPEVARARLAPHAADVRTEVRTLDWAFPEGPSGWVSHLEDDAPPVVAARRAIGEECWATVHDELLEAVRTQGEVRGDGAFAVAPRYLLITARARG